jgi:poly(3-hydroxybutyrate) depolymerase
MVVAQAPASSTVTKPTPGRISENVECAADANQHYALYLPSGYTADRKWKLILLFDAGGRGLRGVERYQAAAEKYGYIVAGSNNSRNGPWEVSLTAAKAMSADVLKRFSIDTARVYTGGMSGGSRVSMKVALEPKEIVGVPVVGVLASSAGFPDELITTVPFGVFGSMGTNDFNHSEMVELDRMMTSPHRIVEFDGTHEWLPAEFATQGVEWMELQAMRSGKAAKNQAVVDAIFAARMQQAEATADALLKHRRLKAIAADFDSLVAGGTLASWKDVSARVQKQDKEKTLREAEGKERLAEERELQLTSEIYTLRDRLRGNPAMHDDVLTKLKNRLSTLDATSKGADDNYERRVARRVIGGFFASSRGVRDPELQTFLDTIRPPRPN